MFSYLALNKRSATQTYQDMKSLTQSLKAKKTGKFLILIKS